MKFRNLFPKYIFFYIPPGLENIYIENKRTEPYSTTLSKNPYLFN